MKNRIENTDHFKSSLDPQVKASPSHQKNQGAYVFFRVDVKELFGIDLSYRGIKKALNQAFLHARNYTPYDSGITYRSMSMREINDHTVEIFYDPKKIIGKKRYGVVIKENYTVFIAENAIRFNWLSIVIYQFYTELFKQVKALSRKQSHLKCAETTKKLLKPTKNDEISLISASLFMKKLREDYKAKKDEARELQKQKQEEKSLRDETIKKRKKEINNLMKGDNI